MERIEVYDPSKFDYNTVNIINEKAQDDEIIVDFNDAKGIKSSFLDKLDKKTKIHITGPLKGEKYNQRRYLARNTYPIDVARKIMRRMEAIEAKVNPDWNDLEKALFVYDTLSTNMTINRDHMNDENYESQSLAALAQGSGICAGFSSIYYEMMNRLGVKCDYVRGRAGNERHAWNILTIDGKQYGIDLTWETSIREKKDKDSINFFGNYMGFNKDHKPDDDETVYNLSILDKEDIIKAKRNIRKETSFDEIVRKDESTFLLSKLGTEQLGDETVFKYVQAEMNGNKIGKTNILYSDNDIDNLDKTSQRLFYDSVLSKDRIDKYLNNQNHYIGGISKDKDGKYFKVVNEKIKELVDGKVSNYRRDDMSNFAISNTSKGSKLKGINNYEVSEFVMVMGEPKLKNNLIYTKNNLLSVKDEKEKNYIANDLLSRHNIDYADRTRGGYVGDTKTILGRQIKKYDKFTVSNLEKEEEKKIA